MQHTRHEKKEAARREFDRWSQRYDRSILQRLLFRPTYEILLEEVVRWRSDTDVMDRPFNALDIGSGTGSWAAMLRCSRLSARLVGLDYSIEMCRRAASKTRELACDGLAFLNGDSEHLPFVDGAFDLITCSHSFHHYPHQPDVVREMRRVLRPGGCLIIVDGFRDNIIGWFVFDVFVAWAEGAVHHVPWSTMRTLVQDAGITDIRQRKFNVWAPAFATIGRV